MDNTDQMCKTLLEHKCTDCQVKKRFKEGLEAFLDKSLVIVLSIGGYMHAFTHCTL